MALNLNAPLKWTAANAQELAMLDDLQGNILKGHGRRSTLNMFIRFGADQAKARAFVRAVGALTVSAHQQLKDVETFKATGVSAGTFVTLLLTKKGYEALGAIAKIPVASDNGAFAANMAGRPGLADPPVAQWDPKYQGEIHALVIIGAEPDGKTKFTSAKADTMGTKILNLLGAAGTVLHTEPGRAIFKTQESKEIEGIEHFGYVDGRSQPLLLTESIQDEADGNDGISVWDPTFPLKSVLVADPGSTGGQSFGSFFVFRKLEQNVKAFKAEEALLGSSAKLNNGELAGATIVGRFEDGTPVVLQREDHADTPVMNNFDYAGDPNGVRCPFHAHIRKSNPRGDSVRAGFATLAEERSHIMARRGITYGVRNKVIDPTDEPTDKVGLLFMAYQSNIANQFEFTQSTWVNNAGFVAGGTGIDPIIGQPGKAHLKHNKVWGDPSKGKLASDFGGHVTMKGGGYFFAPARSTLLSM